MVKMNEFFRVALRRNRGLGGYTASFGSIAIHMVIGRISTAPSKLNRYLVSHQFKERHSLHLQHSRLLLLGIITKTRKKKQREKYPHHQNAAQTLLFGTQSTPRYDPAQSVAMCKANKTSVMTLPESGNKRSTVASANRG